ncbi:JAB domain-containing protein [Furfurilactobacillus entadae]|uniref:JAB domain-containing protein n=1 Tax=Furfurilactobacillus entadae TaxID=2922307 RepID=UPI0035EC05B7
MGKQINLAPVPHRLSVGDQAGSSRLVGINLSDELSHTRQETLLLLSLNVKNQVVARREIFRGTVDACIAHPRDVFYYAILANAARIIVAHNHPSGIASPSSSDEMFGQRLWLGGQLLGIDLLDCFIVGRHSYFSFGEHDLFHGLTVDNALQPVPHDPDV